MQASERVKDESKDEVKEGKKHKDQGRKKFPKNEVGEKRKRENLGDR